MYSVRNVGFTPLLFLTISHLKFTIVIFCFTDSNSRTMLAADQEELDEIEAFEHQTSLERWGVRGAAFALVFALLFLWIWYR